MNNLSTNLYLAMMGYVSYYINGIVGIGVVLVSFVLTALNIFDGVIDPALGYFLDKTEGKYGKFRPFMMIGNLIMISSCLLLFYSTHLIYEKLQLPYFIVIYILFVVGYTLQTLVSKAGQTILTNHPKQRPVSTYFDSLYIMAAFGSTALFVSNYLVPKYGGFHNQKLFKEFVLWVAAIGFFCTILAIIGIWEKDRPEYYGGYGQETLPSDKLKLRDYWEIIRNNKPIRTLIMAACMNKFAASVYSNTTVGVMLFGILMQDYSIAGSIGFITAIPTLLVVTAGIRVAQVWGQKRAFILFTWTGMAFQLMMAILFVFGDLTQIRFHIGIPNQITIGFLVIFVLLNGCKSITNNMVVPMIADCSDYEVYRTGKFVPGLMGALFSFADQVFSALGATFVGITVTLIGFGKVFPQISDMETLPLRWVTIFMYCMIPLISWMVSLYFMKSYELDKKRMREIHKA